MKNKKAIIFIIFIGSMFILSSYNTSSVEIVDHANIEDGIGNSDNIVVSSNGSYYVLIYEDIDFKYYLYASYDEGENWVEVHSITNSENMMDWDMVIDSEDIIWIAYASWFGASMVDVNKYNINSDTASNTNIKTVGTSQKIEDVTITVNSNDYVYVTWFNNDDNDIAFRRYNRQLEIWSSEIQLVTGIATSNSIYLSSGCDSSGDLYVSYINRDDNKLYCVEWDASTSDVEIDEIRTLLANSIYTDLIIDGDNDVNIVYGFHNGTNLGINYTVGDVGSTWYDEEIYRYLGQDQISPKISLTLDGTYYILWVGDNIDLDNAIVGVIGDYSSWSDLYVFEYATDNMHNLGIYGQKYPVSNMFWNGIIGTCENSSDNDQQFFDYGTLLNDSGTSGGGFPECKVSGWTIEKQFEDSIAYYNETLTFVISRISTLLGIYAIMNSTYDVVQSGTFYGSTYPLWYFVDSQYGTGTYYIVAGYDWGDWLINCSFTVVSDDSVADLWILESTKPTFNVGEDVILRYVIPSGEYGNITVTEDGDPLETLTISNILGTGEYEELSFGVSQVGDLCYHGFLRNASNNVLMASTPQFCIGESFFDYDIFVNGEKEVFVTEKDTVSISGYVQGISSEVHIFLVYDGITRYSWAIGDATNKILFARNWRIDYNYTLGDEVYYLYLGTSYGLFEDKFVTLTVSDYAGEPTPFDDGSWYGLPFWVPYLIGVFLTLFITMSPLIIGTYITRNSRIEKINIPPLLYVGFFYFGLIISVVMGFLPSWLPFVILFAMIVYFAVTWLAGKQSSVQGE